MISPVRVDPPADTPVSLEEAKAHLRVDHNDDDALITALVEAATGYLDGYSGILGRALVTQTWRGYFHSFSWCGKLRLPLAPVQSVTSVAYWNTINGDQTVSTSNYSLLSDEQGPYVGLGYGYSWPSTYSRDDAVRVTFIAGYGDPEDVPAPIKAAILLIVADLYASREAKVDARLVENPTVQNLIAPYRRLSI